MTRGTSVGHAYYLTEFIHLFSCSEGILKKMANYANYAWARQSPQPAAKRVEKNEVFGPKVSHMVASVTT